MIKYYNYCDKVKDKQRGSTASQYQKQIKQTGGSIHLPTARGFGEKPKFHNVQRGGHIVRLTENQLREWIPLSCRTGMDCGPNVFTFLGYTTRSVGEFIGQLYRKGITMEQAVTLINVYTRQKIVYNL